MRTECSNKIKRQTDKKSYNGLIIYVWKDTPYFYNPMGVDREQLSVLTVQTNHKYIERKHYIYFGSGVPKSKELIQRDPSVYEY